MILDQLASHAKKRVEKAKEHMSLSELKNAVRSFTMGDFPFEKALKKDELSFICEIKKASPSKGIIDPEFDYLNIAKEYERIGTDCVSCLTEPKWFLGSDDIFRQIRKSISLPMLRKDFTVDEYQLYESKCMGADAILLICALLDTQTITEYLKICDQLGLSALVEAHNEEEVKSAVCAGARMIGVNNRNLKDFSVDIQNAVSLRRLVPPGVLFVAESGIQSAHDITALQGLGADAVLIGESMMRTSNKQTLLQMFREASR